MSALARDIGRPKPPITEPGRTGAAPSVDAGRGARLLAFAPPVVAPPEQPAALYPWFEDPRPNPLRADAPRRSPRFSDRQLSVFIALIGLLIVATHEFRFSTAQATWWARLSSPLQFELAPGPNPVPLPPDAGPYDERLGYARLPEQVARLQSMGFTVADQARPSPEMYAFSARGLDVIYPEKSRAGLTLFDRNGRTMYSVRYPHFVYERFESVPRLLVSSLLFIEDRELMDGRWTRNPVVDWERLSKAAGLRALSYVGLDDTVIGGSTLATQLEKFRHSPGGRTETPLEKVQQMASASVRIYRFGTDTQRAREQLVTDYINSLPLAGRSNQGEIIGLGDGMQAWYGDDFAAMNRAIVVAETNPEQGARAYKRALSLFVAARRPSYYLTHPAALEALTDSYIRVMGNAGAIPAALRDAALEQRLEMVGRGPDRLIAANRFVEQKDINLARGRLAHLLEVDGLYALDHLDLDAKTTIDAPIQSVVSATLTSLKDPETIKRAGLLGDRLLSAGDPAKVIYSFTLFERSAHGNLLRINTDNLDQPFDINTGARIDLGSTSKLRTLITYLEFVAEAHARYAALTPEELRAIRIPEKDRLSAWVVGYLLEVPGADLTSTLRAAMQRTYSASPYQDFLTGSGVQRFSNFDRNDNDRVMTLEHALQNSVNLVFVRLMREITDHLTYRTPSVAAALLEDPTHPERSAYLSRFADSEGRQFVRRFYRKYSGQTGDGALELALESARSSARAIATITRSVRPDAPVSVLAEHLAKRLPPAARLSAEDVDELYYKYSPERFSLSDRGYLARVHPLELWVAAYLGAHPKATLADVLSESTSARQEVYRWLDNSHRRRGQDRRIAQLFEIDAFLEIHERWQRLGYPFASVTPSLATALGASGDRPGALAELMGIVVNDGIRYPNVLVDDLHFAGETPYETRLTRSPAIGERVLAPEVASVVRDAIVKVVESGTAIALKSKLTGDGFAHVVGGKTGTGDHRSKVFARGGRLVESRVMNRAATFVFMIDGRFFGTVTAFVPGADAAHYQFTSSLPVRVLGLLLPQLEPLLRHPSDDDPSVCDGRPCELVARR